MASSAAEARDLSALGKRTGVPVPVTVISSSETTPLVHKGTQDRRNSAEDQFGGHAVCPDAGRMCPTPGDPKKGASLLCDPCGWCQNLCDKHSWQLLGSTVVTHHLLKGFVAGGGDEGLLGKPVEFLLRAQNVPAARLQALQAVGTAPWVLKPIIGYLSDSMPLCGYKKAPYAIITTLIAIVAVACLGFQMVQHPSLIALCLFFAYLQIAAATLFVDAKQSEATKGNADLGPEYITFTMVGMNVGMFASLVIAGTLITYAGPHSAYLFALPFVALLLLPVCCNWLQEVKLAPDQSGFSLAAARRSPCVLTLSLILVPLVSALAIGSMMDFPSHILLYISLIASVMMLLGYLLLVRFEIGGPVAFSFGLRLANLHIDGAMFYFYTNTAEQYPAGPHFSPFFYVSCLGACAISGLIVGFISGNGMFKEMSYRRSMFITILLRSCTQLTLIPLLLRWNVAYGVPDAFYAPLVTFFDTMTCAWRQIPMSVLFLQATPLGLESSMSALNAGTSNLGIMISFFLGGFALVMMGVEPAGNPGESGEFANLWKVQAMAALLPVLTLVFLPFLIPSATQTEQLIVENKESTTHNAPFTRLFPRWA